MRTWGEMGYMHVTNGKKRATKTRKPSSTRLAGELVARGGSYRFLRDLFGYFFERYLQIKDVALVLKQIFCGATLFHLLRVRY